MSGLNPYLLMTSDHNVLGTVQRDDPEKLRTILAEKKFPDQYDLSRGLIYASQKGFEECVKVLLQAKALPDIHNANGYSPLVIAARYDHPSILKLLIQANCNINKSTFGVRATALHWAATNGNTRCVRVLLANGINIEARTIHGRTALMLAARSGFDEVVDALIEAGADATAEDLEKATALHQAAEEGATECARSLIAAGADVNVQKKDGQAPLLLAAKGGHIPTLRLLMLYNCDVTVLSCCMNVLHWAAEGGNAECVEALLEKGMDANEETLDSYYGANFVVNRAVTPLMLAARRGHSASLQVLISSGADVNRYDQEHYSALHYAVKRNHGECVKILLDAQADPEGPLLDQDSGARGIPALFLAIKDNCREATKALLRGNVNLHSVGYYGTDEPLTGYELAFKKGHFSAAQMLLLAGYNPWNVNAVIFGEAMATLIEENEELFMWFTNFLHIPRSLIHQCGICIRKNLGRRVIHQVACLPVPKSIRDYIALNDLDDV